MADPADELWLPREVTETVLVVDQAKDADPARPEPSVATTNTEAEPGVVGVPEITPVAVLMVRPAGRPVADQEMVVPDAESVAGTDTGVTAEPVTLV